jgi:hypothetical protein
MKKKALSKNLDSKRETAETQKSNTKIGMRRVDEFPPSS